METWDAKKALQDLPLAEEPDDLLRNFSFLLPKTGLGLDLGSGDGRNSLFLAQMGLQMKAVDSSRLALSRLKEKIREQNLDILTFRQDMMEFHLEPHQYDVILCLWSLMYLQPQQILTLAHRMMAGLRPSGLLFCSVFTDQDPNFSAAQQWLVPVGERLYQKKGWGTFYFFTTNELETLFQDLRLLYYAEGHSTDFLRGARPHRHNWAQLTAQRPPEEI
jgi:2-polyprenyl-3-methyl-5-hydroxy-6-metoxy-1,4-benzoquinol methylase